MPETRTYHMRRPLRRSRSTNWYRDYSDRGQGTFCKAPETDHDICCYMKAGAWIIGGIAYEPCDDCVRIRQQARAKNAPIEKAG